jgi:FMN phosphatase YigB (HAD superfamily)
VLPLLKQLRARHQQPESGRVVIGIITNSDNRTADILTSMGVRVNPLHHGDQPKPEPPTSQKQFDIDFTVLSYDVGYEKPDTRIFTAAEEMLASLLATDGQQQVDASEWRKVYVGDEYAKDVVGATEAGWKAVLIDREVDGQNEDVVWLHEDQPASLWDVLARTTAVGFSSLGQLGEWLPKRG